jgi:hypothetical protein
VAPVKDVPARFWRGGAGQSSESPGAANSPPASLRRNAESWGRAPDRAALSSHCRSFCANFLVKDMVGTADARHVGFV